jgi:hypothetical protein
MTFSELVEIASSLGLELTESDGIYHMVDESGHTDFRNEYTTLDGVETDLEAFDNGDDGPNDYILEQQEMEDFEGIDLFQDAEYEGGLDCYDEY